MKRLMIALVALCGLSLHAQGQTSPCTLSGVVTDGTEPVFMANAVVCADGKALRGAVTDEEGRYRIDSLAPGEYRLELSGFGFERYDTLIRLSADMEAGTIALTRSTRLLGSRLWMELNRLDSVHPATDFYRRTYIDFRRAIDALAPKFSEETESFPTAGIPDAMPLMEALPGIRMESGWVLDIGYDGGSAGGSMYLYARQEKGKRLHRTKYIDNAMQHIVADFTPQGLWSAYLLHTSYDFMPKYWHGGYRRYNQVFSGSEAAKQFSGRLSKKYQATHDSLMAVPPLIRQIAIADSGHAVITTYTWNDWEGLVEHHIYVERTAKGLKFHSPYVKRAPAMSWRKVLVEFDCGIMY